MRWLLFLALPCSVWSFIARRVNNLQTHSRLFNVDERNGANEFPKTLKNAGTEGPRRLARLISAFGGFQVVNGLLASPSYAWPSAAVESLDETASFASLQEAAEFIEKNCPTILSAARESGKLLYRGEESPTNKACLKSPGFDLLSSAAYSSNGGAAADFFLCLDRALRLRSLPIYPSVSHLATPNVMLASEWGAVQSVWPLEGGLHFAYPLGEQTWWQGAWAQPQGPRGPFFWRDGERLGRFIEEEVAVDQNLANALSRGAEVMFCRLNGSEALSPSYVSVPLALEPPLLSLLKVKPFSSRSSVRLASPMEVEDVRKGSPRKYLLY